MHQLLCLFQLGVLLALTACGGPAATPTGNVPVTQTGATQVARPTEVAARSTNTAQAQPVAPASPATAPTSRPTAAASPTAAPRATPTLTAADPSAPGTAGAAQPVPLAPLTDGVAYVDPAGRFSFTVPYGWARNSTPRTGKPDTLVRFSGPGNARAGDVAIVLEDVSGRPGIALESYAQETVAQVRTSAPEYQFIGLAPVIIDQRPAYRHSFQGLRQGDPRYQEEVYLLDGATVHLLSFVGLPENRRSHVSTFAAIAGSYRIGDRPPVAPAPAWPWIEVVPDEGAQHYREGTPLSYQHYPPSSGPHYPSPQPAGVYQAEVPVGRWMHSLEHGYVVALVRCPDGCPELYQQLGAFYQQAPKGPLGSVKLIVTPYSGSFSDPTKEAPLTLLAWNRELMLPQFDPDAVRAFYTAYVDQGPEAVP